MTDLKIDPDELQKYHSPEIMRELRSRINDCKDATLLDILLILRGYRLEITSHQKKTMCREPIDGVKMSEEKYCYCKSRC